MEFLPILFFVVLLAFFIFLAKNRAKIKGRIGEISVASRLNSLNHNDYKILNNVILQTKNGGTVQIDHIIVSVYGIFVIETTNYKGWIFGNENAENWMQVIYKEKNQFRNPIKQNWAHVYALKNLLADFPNAKFIPIVVFTGSGILKEISASSIVVYDTRLLRAIKNESREENLSPEEVDDIIQVIESHNIEDRKNEKQHVENIHKTIFENRQKVKNQICPKCGNELKLRSGKYGKFYGCSNYPYCKFTMKF